MSQSKRLLPDIPTQSDRPLQRWLIQQQTASSGSSEAKSSVFRMNTGDAYQEEVVQKDLGAQKGKSTKGPLQANRGQPTNHSGYHRTIKDSIECIKAQE